MAPKRKSLQQLEKKREKRSKIESKELLSLEQVKALGEEIKNASKFNNFVQLLEQLKIIQGILIEKESIEVETLGRLILLVVFERFEALFDEGMMRGSKKQDEKQRLVTNWLADKYETFKSIILKLLSSKLYSETSLQLDSMEIYLSMIKLESQSSEKQFPKKTYQQFLEAVLHNRIGEDSSDGSSNNFIVLEFSEIFKNYWDLQFYFFDVVNDVLCSWKDKLSDKKLQRIFANFVTIIRNGLKFKPEDLEDEPTWVPKDKLPSTLYKHNKFKSQFQKCILTILSYPLSSPQYKSILLILHKRIIPYMSQPQGLMDFLTDAYNLQDDLIIPILSLNSLYELIKNYNLEYPDFYAKLYSLLRPELFYTRYRSRFFRLCDLFLSSTHLSASLVASFIKKLARLALTSSASGVVIIIPFIYNLLKRHPTCMIMLHNTDESQLGDPFENLETNPLNTKAIESSLWELETLMGHYHPNIATLARIFGEPFRKPNYNMEDFLDWSYQSLMETEKSRRYKNQAALEFESFDSVLAENGKEGNILLDGWSL
ncbi:NOC4 [Candida margitis]|uniref:NOC4 n=1 Tax=Candida margitis TaxID=1775924 RepID=UPI002225C613|nr:NOC4 [Candida margitis]KAI5969472.1 NOC4 [Candida margitis]